MDSAEEPRVARTAPGLAEATGPASRTAPGTSPEEGMPRQTPPMSEPVWLGAPAEPEMGPSLVDRPLGADSWLDDADLDMEPRFVDAVEKVVRRQEHRRAHEPLF